MRILHVQVTPAEYTTNEGSYYPFGFQLGVLLVLLSSHVWRATRRPGSFAGGLVSTMSQKVSHLTPLSAAIDMKSCG